MQNMRKLTVSFLLILIVIGLLIVSAIVYTKQDKFGQEPSKDKVKLYAKLANFKDGKFENISFTPELTEGNSMLSVGYEYFFKQSPRRKPTNIIPSIKTDLLNLPLDSNVLVWFGHSSYFIQIDGKRFLVDPVFSGNASPIPGTNKAFEGADAYSVADLPNIDYLLISHDHYDHLDFETIMALKTKVNKIICGLGVSSHFEAWGFSNNMIIEKNWYEKEELENGFKVFCEPARHFSGRGFSRNNTLWVSFLLQTPSMKIYIGGDSGYDKHFAEIGKKHGEIDLAILDNGQYDTAWQFIHSMPNEVLKEAKELNTKRMFPVHSSKFAMANHAWDEPLIKITELNKEVGIPLVTPIIGELVLLKNEKQEFKQWWLDLK
jgi:L-ascorbate metabolism protein UlaG (beta-lactamase superfamily)